MRKRHGHAAAPQSCSMLGTMGRLTIVIAVFNAAAVIVAAVADGGSCDGTTPPDNADRLIDAALLAKRYGDLPRSAAQGRAGP